MSPESAFIQAFLYAIPTALACVLLGLLAVRVTPRISGFLDWLTGTRPDYSVTRDLREPGQLPDVDDAGRWRA